MKIEEKLATFSICGGTKNLTTRRMRRIGISVASWSCLALSGLCFYLAGNGSAREVLPRSEPKCKETIGRTYKDCTLDRISLINAPAGAPSVLFLMIDDAGFSDWSTLSGQITKGEAMVLKYCAQKAAAPPFLERATTPAWGDECVRSFNRWRRSRALTTPTGS